MSRDLESTVGQMPRMTLFLGIITAVSVFGVVVGVVALARISRTAAADQGEVVRDGMVREQALHCARTGLTEAINWMRRQPAQPVVRFAPTRVDSMDPRIGMVREFPITDRLWGRFEVWRREGVCDGDGAGDSVTRRRLGVEDVSIAEGHPGSGAVWRMRCAGFVFEREHPDDLFDRNSATVLQSEVLEVDVARLGLRLPGQAALCARSGESMVVGRKARVDGGGSAVGIYSGHAGNGTGGVADVADLADVADVAAGSVRGVRGVVSAASPELYDDSVISVFGVRRTTLFAMADAWVTNADHFPLRLPANSIYCVEVPRLTCTAVRPLRGSGILFVRGDLSIEAGSAARFTGLVYVDGDLSIHSKASFTGAVVVTGRVSIQGGRETAKLVYDDGILRGLRDAVGSYRVATPITRLGDELSAEGYGELDK